jgi:hypothetical protein
MLMPVLASELARIALEKISKLELDDAVKALKTLQRATGGGLLMPGLAIFGAGVAVGAGVGLLFAPRTGAETRERLRRSTSQQLDALKKRFAERRVEVVGMSESSAASAARPTNGNGAQA